ncbi:hypothetical protein NL676_009315 [Syzygium grande]|nr:hypothetical protein NL676_009315 [Syzygium grande]
MVSGYGRPAMASGKRRQSVDGWETELSKAHNCSLCTLHYCLHIAKALVHWRKEREGETAISSLGRRKDGVVGHVEPKPEQRRRSKVADSSGTFERMAEDELTLPEGASQHQFSTRLPWNPATSFLGEISALSGKEEPTLWIRQWMDT